jgi:hypothetical protein
MAARKRILKKISHYRTPKTEEETEEQDLKKVKAKTLEELAEDQKKANEWLDKELEKNLKNS